MGCQGIPGLSQLHGVTPVISQGFHTSPHALGITCIKVSLNTLFGPAFGLPDAPLEVLPGSTVGHDVTLPEGFLSLSIDLTFHQIL